MLMKNCNASDFTHKQKFKTLMHDNLVRGPFSVINQVGGPVHLHISKVTTCQWSLYLNKSSETR